MEALLGPDVRLNWHNIVNVMERACLAAGSYVLDKSPSRREDKTHYREAVSFTRGDGATIMCACLTGSQPSHIHESDDENVLFYGEATIMIGDDTRKVSYGDTVQIPAGTPHRVTASSGSVWLQIERTPVRS